MEFRLLQRLFKELKSAQKYLWAGLFLYIPVTLLAISQPMIIGYAVQHAMLDGSSASLVSYAAIFLSSVLMLALLELALGSCLQTAGQMLIKNLRKLAFDKVQRFSMAFLDATPMGRLITRLTNDAEAVAELFSMGAVQIVGDMLFLLGTFIMLLVVDIKLSLYAVLGLVVLAIGLHYFRFYTKKAYVAVREVLSSLNIFLQEYLSGMPTVQMAGRLKGMQENFSHHNQEFLLTNRQAIFLDAALYSFVDAISYLVSALVLLGAFRLKLEHALALGILVAFLEALSRFFQPVRELSNRYAVFQSSMVALWRIYELFDWPEEVDAGQASLQRDFTKLQFKNVSFAYQAGEPVINDVSFTVRKGERLALVGPSGAGKSTVIKLLNRFYPVSEGAILIDEQNIDELSLRASRNLISVVPQEVFLFLGTLQDNLRFGNPQAHDEELWAALALVQMKDAIIARGGLLAAVKTKGDNFSQGEKQLLAIARALVTNPPILVLDEATAGVDVLAEARLAIATKALLKDRTAIVIAHRLSTIKDADRILVFSKGRIVEEGDHQSLMHKQGFYHELIRLSEQGSHLEL